MVSTRLGGGEGIAEYIIPYQSRTTCEEISMRTKEKSAGNDNYMYLRDACVN